MELLSRQLLKQQAVHQVLGDERELARFVAEHPSLFVITGAGISHASGIPTYRDEIGNWKGHSPMQHGEFIRDHAMRQRYWARSYRGWPNVAQAAPNDAHRALAELEARGYVRTLVSQNIDRLHQRAGHRKVIDLHGRLDQVVCMDCGALSERAVVQDWLGQHNTFLLDQQQPRSAPDGDADVDEELIGGIRVPDCLDCGGMLKPNVVFYGSSVSKETVNYLMQRLAESDAILVVGTSLMVFSVYRFCKQAMAEGMPMACVNRGLTRADGHYRVKVDGDCGTSLARLLELLPGA